MFNVVINNEQYDEYLAQKARIKELETRNEFLKTQYDQLNSLHQEALSEKAVLKDENDRFLKKAKQVESSDGICKKLMKENGELKEKIKALEASNVLLKGDLESTYGNYQQSLSVKAALIKERNELINEREELKNTNIRFKMSNNDLGENNKELKKENEKLINRLHDYESQIAEMSEKAINPDYVKFLEMVKKFQEYIVAVHLDVLEEFQPACNLNIENLYITNNYFSEEDEDNE